MKFVVYILFLFSVTLMAQEKNDGYAPELKNKMNPSVYDWNALNTEWINMRALGMLALDYSNFIQDSNSQEHLGNLNTHDTFNIRGIRLGAVGTINFQKPWVYLISASLNSLNKDFKDGVDDKQTIMDFTLGIPLWGQYGRMQIGKMKAPISMERNMGLVFEQVMERAMHLDTLLPSRSIGLSFSDLLLDKRLNYRLGVYNDWIQKHGLSASQSNEQYIARVSTVAYEDAKENKLLHLGVGYRYDDIREGTLQFTTRPEEFYVYPWLDTGVFEAQNSSTYNLELTYMDGPLWLASEYTSTSVKSTQAGDPTFAGYHVSANYFLTGEHRGYNHRLGRVRRVTPLLGISDRGVGAVEISVRYSYMDLNDANVKGGEMDISSIGLIWHPRRDIQFHCQYSRANLNKTNIELSNTLSQSKTDIFQARIVILID